MMKSKNIEGISILVPSRNRPENITDMSISVDKTTSQHEKVELIFGVHEDDILSVNTINHLKSSLSISLRCELIKKHESGDTHLSYLWNQIYDRAKYPILGYFGDDVIFKTYGWDLETEKEFQRDKNIMVMCNNVFRPYEKSATLFFTHKSTHEKFGFYLNMRFKRWYSDTYWDSIYRNSGKLIYRQDILVEHHHPDIFPERRDEVYTSMEVYIAEDIRTWHSEEMQKEILRNME